MPAMRDLISIFTGVDNRPRTRRCVCGLFGVGFVRSILRTRGEMVYTTWHARP
jgi:hypothetical protein